MKDFELHLRKAGLAENTIRSYLYGVRFFLEHYELKIEDLFEKSLTFVTVTSEQAKEISKDLKVTIVSDDGNTIKFGNNLPDDELIKKLSKYKIDRILIEEATLEDMFLHYYKQGDKYV